MSTTEVFNIDCMIGMKQYPDKFFDLAVVDPPYNVGASDGRFGGQTSKPSRINGRLGGKNYVNHDRVPEENYFKEMFRISKHQIVWGANYYPQYFNHSGWIVWDKENKTNGVLSDCELAYQSINKMVRKFTSAWSGFNKKDFDGHSDIRIHPNQKPVSIYSWIYKNYLPNGGKVIDTHLGSGSSRIAADRAGNIDFTGYELDKDYYEAQEKRWKNYKAQLNLFA